jgi:thymidylate synthase (FAD)
MSETRAVLLSCTERPEETIARAARGDYEDRFVGDKQFWDLIKHIDYDDRHEELVDDALDLDDGVPVGEQPAKMMALLERLFRHEHWGPFEHAQLTIAFENVSRHTMAQLTRHRHATFDVQSLRFVDFRESGADFNVPPSLTDPDHATRHGSVDLDDDERETAHDIYEDTMELLVDRYSELRELGVPAEDARQVLPMSTEVNLTVSLNARTVLHILNMRSKGDAQKEIRDLSDELLRVFAESLPLTAHLWDLHGPFTESP